MTVNGNIRMIGDAIESSGDYNNRITLPNYRLTIPHCRFAANSDFKADLFNPKPVIIDVELNEITKSSVIMQEMTRLTFQDMFINTVFIGVGFVIPALFAMNGWPNYITWLIGIMFAVITFIHIYIRDRMIQNGRIIRRDCGFCMLTCDIVTQWITMEIVCLSSRCILNIREDGVLKSRLYYSLDLTYDPAALVCC